MSDGECCGAAGPKGYGCTLEPNHDGWHTAHGVYGETYDIWSRAAIRDMSIPELRAEIARLKDVVEQCLERTLERDRRIEKALRLHRMVVDFDASGEEIEHCYECGHIAGEPPEDVCNTERLLRSES